MPGSIFRHHIMVGRITYAKLRDKLSFSTGFFFERGPFSIKTNRQNDNTYLSSIVTIVLYYEEP